MLELILAVVIIIMVSGFFLKILSDLIKH